MKEKGKKFALKGLGTALAIVVAVLAVAFIIMSSLGDGVNIWQLKKGEAAEEADPGTDSTSGNSAASVEEGLVRLACAEELGDMDVAKNQAYYHLPLNIYDRLVEIRQEGGVSLIKPSLAKEWTVSPDGKTYSFTLRDDVVFSDGTRLTADDVRFSFTRLLTVPGSEQTAFADMIQGADEVLSGAADELSGIKVTDDTHIAITLKEPFPAYISMLGAPACSILCRKKTEEAGDSFGTDPAYIIGSGPYILTGMDDNSYTLEANPLYWGEAPSVKKAILSVMAPALMDQAFRNGELDLLDLELVNSGAAEYYLKNEVYDDTRTEKDNVEILSLMLNTKIPPLDNPKVRRAVQLAIDRERIIEEVCGGHARLTDGIFPMGLTGYSEENQGWLKYDPEEARRLIGEADLSEGSTVELVLDSDADEGEQRRMEIIRENLRAVGLNAVIVVYDHESSRYLKKEGQVMAYVFKWIADFNDPDNFIYTIFGSEEAVRRYSSNYSDSGVIKRIAEARNMEDEAERLKEYANLERKLVQEDAVWVPLYSAGHVFIRGERVRNYTTYWAGWSDITLKGIELK